LNLGENVLISGTVGAAMQAYLRGFPALAVSVSYENSQQYLDAAARIAALLVPEIVADPLLSDILCHCQQSGRQKSPGLPARATWTPQWKRIITSSNTT